MSNSPPLACNLGALTDEERKTWSELVHSLREAVVRLEERDQGYQVTLDPEKLSRIQVEHLVRMESKCCPFLSFQLETDAESGGTVLDISGPPGVKEFLRMEFGVSETTK